MTTIKIPLSVRISVDFQIFLNRKIFKLAPDELYETTIKDFKALKGFDMAAFEEYVRQKVYGSK